MTHTFDSEVSLHSWLLWPSVRLAPHAAAAAAASSFSLAVNGCKIWHLLNWEQIWKKCNKETLRMEKRNNGKRCSVLLESYTLKAVKPAHDKYLFAAISYGMNVLTNIT